MRGGRDIEEPVEQIEIVNNPKHDSGFKIEEHHPLTIVGLMRNSEAESKAMRLNFKEQRLLTKYYGKIDADCSYVMRINNLDHKMAAKQQERLRVKSSKIKSYLAPEEHAAFDIEGSRGHFVLPKDIFVRSVNFNSAKIISAAHSRLFKRTTGELPSYLKKMKSDRTSMTLRQDTKVTFDSKANSKIQYSNVTEVESEIDDSDNMSESDDGAKLSHRVKSAHRIRAVQSAVNCGGVSPPRPLTTWSTYPGGQNQTNGSKPSGYVPFTGQASKSWTPRRPETRISARTSSHSPFFNKSSTLTPFHSNSNEKSLFEMHERKQHWLTNEQKKMEQLTNMHVRTFIDSLGNMKLEKPMFTSVFGNNETVQAM